MKKITGRKDRGCSRKTTYMALYSVMELVIQEILITGCTDLEQIEKDN